MENRFPFTITGYEGQYAALDKFDSRNWAKQIHAPTLIITANQDIIFNPNLSEALANEISGSKYYCFKNCGHLPHIEYPEEYVSLVRNFLNGYS